LTETPAQLVLRGGFLSVGDDWLLPLTGATCEYGTSRSRRRARRTAPTADPDRTSPNAKTRRRKSGNAFRIESIRAS